jgi:hypothetical protein
LIAACWAFKCAADQPELSFPLPQRVHPGQVKCRTVRRRQLHNTKSAEVCRAIVDRGSPSALSRCPRGSPAPAASVGTWGDARASRSRRRNHWRIGAKQGVAAAREETSPKRGTRSPGSNDRLPWGKEWLTGGAILVRLLSTALSVGPAWHSAPSRSEHKTGSLAFPLTGDRKSLVDRASSAGAQFESPQGSARINEVRASTLRLRPDEQAYRPRGPGRPCRR